MKPHKLSDYLRPKFTVASNETRAPRSETKPKSKSKKRPSPISLRLNENELASLRRAAIGRSVNGYIRECLFGNAGASETTKPVAEDYEALARVLGALGRTDVYTNLAVISLALEQNRLRVGTSTERAITEACRAIIEMRADLLLALGLRKT